MECHPQGYQTASWLRVDLVMLLKSELKYSLYNKLSDTLRYSGVTLSLFTLFQGIFNLIISVSGLVDDREHSLIIVTIIVIIIIMNNLLILFFTNIISKYY